MTRLQLADRLTSAAGWLLAFLPLTYLAGVAITDIGGMAIVALFLLRSGLSGDWAWGRRPWVRLAFLLCAYLALRGAFALDPGSAVQRAVEWLRFPLLAAALGYWLLSDATIRRRFFRGWLATVLLLIVDCLWQWGTGRDLLGHPSVPLAGEGAMARLTGPFRDPKAGIVLAWLLFPAAAGLVCGRRAWIGGGLWLLGAVTVFLTGERMALLLVGLGALAVWLLLPRLRAPGLWLGVVLALVLAGAAFLRPAMLERHVTSTLAIARHLDESAYGRIWSSATALIADQPVFGVGLRHFRERCPDPRYGDRPGERCNLHPHHLYLEWLAETGVAGTTLFLLLLTAWGRELWRGRRQGRGHAEWPGVLAACFLRLWPLATATSFFVAWSALPFWLAFGWALGMVHSHETKGDASC